MRRSATRVYGSCDPWLESPGYHHGLALRGKVSSYPKTDLRTVRLDNIALYCKVMAMDPNWAAEHLQVIRTLMERSAIYRRALAPVMLLLGILGITAGVAGWWFSVSASRAFGTYWIAVSIVGISGAYLMVRRQSLRDAEPFWSPPTRRVTLAALPAAFIGFVVSVLILQELPQASVDAGSLPPIWMALYGCAIHAAGFFMPRGMKLFGWLFIFAACTVGAALAFSWIPRSSAAGHAVMGASFGGLHLLYGIYLYFTEVRKNEA